MNQYKIVTIRFNLKKPGDAILYWFLQKKVQPNRRSSFIKRALIDAIRQLSSQSSSAGKDVTQRTRQETTKSRSIDDLIF